MSMKFSVYEMLNESPYIIQRVQQYSLQGTYNLFEEI